MRKPEKSAGEKTNQHKVSAPIPDKAKYPPGTIGSNKDLARQEALVEIQRLGPDLPQVLEYGFYVRNAFYYASLLAVEGRQPLLNTRAGFIGDYVRLVVNFDCAEKIRVLNSGTPFLEKWPQNPEKFGPDAGSSALDVAYKFSKRILDALLFARTKSLGVEVHNQFDYLSINDRRIDRWIEVFRVGCHGQILPVQAQWPTWQIKTDANFLICKLGNEYDLAKQALASKQPTVASGKGETKTEPQNIEGEWSKPMSKTDIMRRLGLGLKGYRKLNTFTKEHPIRDVAGNRQLWQIRIDKMPSNLREKFK